MLTSRDTCPLSIFTFLSILHLKDKVARVVYKYTYKYFLFLIRISVHLIKMFF